MASGEACRVTGADSVHMPDEAESSPSNASSSGDSNDGHELGLSSVGCSSDTIECSAELQRWTSCSGGRVARSSCLRDFRRGVGPTICRSRSAGSQSDSVGDGVLLNDEFAGAVLAGVDSNANRILQ